MIAAVLLGVVDVASPGTTKVATLRRGLRGGLDGSLAVQLGALLGDAPYLVLAPLGSNTVVPRVPPDSYAPGGFLMRRRAGCVDRSCRVAEALAATDAGHRHAFNHLIRRVFGPMDRGLVAAHERVDPTSIAHD